MTAARRVGILGGTFDPIHCGHLDAGAAAQRTLDLDTILVLPCNVPPHRPPPMASRYHRFAMVALAIAGRPGWRALDLELRVEGRSYTWDTLRRLHADGFNPAELFFITGADAFVEIATWKNYPEVLDLAHFAVVSRRGVPVGELPARLIALEGRMRAVATPHAGRGHATDAEGPTLIFLIDAATADVSATAIRGALGRRESISGMVTASVRQHIEQHALYEDIGSVPGARERD
jgi:nicotinate-nucleotide adenylyltransferase